MRGLSVRDYDQMLDLASALYHDPGPGPSWPRLLTGLGECLHGTIGVLAALRWDAGVGRMLVGRPEWLGQQRMDTLITTHMRAHPLMRMYAASHSTTPLTLNDVADASWWRSEAHQVGRDAIGVTQQLALPLRAPPGVIRTLVIGRDGTDFSERDRAVARRLQPLLMGIDSHLRQLDVLRRSVPATSAPRTPELRAAEHGITPRELTVLTLLAQGLTAAASARRLCISVHTVLKHRENLYRKLGSHDRLTTVLLAQERGLLPTFSAVGRQEC
ncbi:LuxR C-terminal-related transcriptional regulator [Streptomyces sp. NPDC041068]|uniref:helix-turn-helix transcriptional regulator n=1 Tax=Streptomyces sp. NPDC041068 TaxID=3155130 RepID=UPI0033C502D1